jgi:hypothetical protein
MAAQQINTAWGLSSERRIFFVFFDKLFFDEIYSFLDFHGII